MHVPAWRFETLCGPSRLGRMTLRFVPARRMRRLVVLFIGASCLAGCFGRASGDEMGSGGAGTGSQGAGGSSGAPQYPEDDPNVVCRRPDGVLCFTGTTCASYTGFAIDEAVACRDDTPVEFPVCALPNTGCPAAKTLGRDTSGQLWHFLTTCLPPGFQDEGASAYQPCTTGGLGGHGGQSR
jgi:hypothetical protein